MKHTYVCLPKDKALTAYHFLAQLKLEPIKEQKQIVLSVSAPFVLENALPCKFEYQTFEEVQGRETGKYHYSTFSHSMIESKPSSLSEGDSSALYEVHPDHIIKLRIKIPGWSFEIYNVLSDEF
jgi:hypothetical protein